MTNEEEERVRQILRPQGESDPIKEREARAAKEKMQAEAAEQRKTAGLSRLLLLLLLLTLLLAAGRWFLQWFQS